MSWEQIIKNQERQRDSGGSAPQRVKPKPPTITTKPDTNVTTGQGTNVDNRPEVESEPEHPPHCQCNFPKCKQKAEWKCQYCGAIQCNFHKTRVTGRRSVSSGQMADHIHHFVKGSCDENNIFRTK